MGHCGNIHYKWDEEADSFTMQRGGKACNCLEWDLYILTWQIGKTALKLHRLVHFHRFSSWGESGKTQRQSEGLKADRERYLKTEHKEMGTDREKGTKWKEERLSGIIKLWHGIVIDTEGKYCNERTNKTLKELPEVKWKWKHYFRIKLGFSVLSRHSFSFVRPACLPGFLTDMCWLFVPVSASSPASSIKWAEADLHITKLSKLTVFVRLVDFNSTFCLVMEIINDSSMNLG